MRRDSTGIYMYLTDNGSVSGNRIAIGNYSDAGDGETIFYRQPPKGEIWLISRMLIQIKDTGVIKPEEYGSGLVLTNGVQVRVQDDDRTVLDLTDTLKVKSNTEWAKVCFDDRPDAYGGSNSGFVSIRWSFYKGGEPIELNGDMNERLEVPLNDDFRGLVSHTFYIHGMKKY